MQKTQIHQLRESFKIIYSSFLVLILSFNAKAQMGVHGTRTVTGTNVELNTRTYLTANATVGATSISVNNSSMTGAGFATGLMAGDLVLIIQMQGATISNANTSAFGSVNSYNNAGRYEFRCVSSVPNATTIMFTVPLTNAYTANGHVQVVRIPRYSSMTINAGNSIRPATWNGTTGGITAIEISGNAIINGTITASGRGFRGGAIDNNSQSASTQTTSWFSNSDADGGEKGEGIAGYGSAEYQAMSARYGRGAPANGGGGGNSHNAGGGGGANGGSIAAWNGLGNPDNSGLSYSLAWNLESLLFSANTSSGGGRGGYTYGANNRNAITTAPGNSNWGGNNRENVGGYGGRPLDYSSGRIFLGGGGGAGDGNNGGSAAGGNGGGLIFIICYGNITGNGTIITNGDQGSNTSGSHNDAPGGGGAGGTIILTASGSISNSLILNAIGGKGGDQLISGNESEGPGGGGGGGYIAISSGSPVRAVNGGANGTSTSSAVTEFTPNGATAGGSGTGNATYAVSNIRVNFSANAGPNMNFCTSASLNASLSSGTRGTWSVITGTGGSFTNSNIPNAIFTGDSSQTYSLLWTVNSILCEVKYDTLVLNPICMPLPVQLISFDGEWVESGVKLKWSSVKHDYFKHYIVEKQLNGGDWIQITTIEPELDNQASIQNYEWLDQSFISGSVSYRLRMVDLDLSYNHSSSIEFNSTDRIGDINLYPVPACEFLNVDGSILKNANIKILNANGIEVDVEIQYNNNQAKIDLTLLPAGFYQLIVIKNGQTIKGKSFIHELR